jgi:hypothetical protein
MLKAAWYETRWKTGACRCRKGEELSLESEAAAAQRIVVALGHLECLFRTGQESYMVSS